MLSVDVRKESGTCNVCSTPCSSCMHRITDVSEANIRHDRKREETSSCSFNCAKNRACYDAHVVSEASNFCSASSSQNSYSGNVGSQSVLRSSVAFETSEAVDMPSKFSIGNISSQALENGNDCIQKVVEVDESDDIARCNESNEQLEKHSSVLRESNRQGFQIQVQPHSMADAQASESGIGLIDVNVCDICGDAGREAFLATCSRCVDGAEHTYCMRVKLNEIPKDDWICEQCEIKERTEKKINCDASPISNSSEGNKKMNLKPATSSRTTNSANLSAKTVSSKACGSLSVKQNSFKLRKHIMAAATIPAVIKELSETNNGLIVSPRHRNSPVFSHSKSFRHMEMIKSKPMNTVSSPRFQPKGSSQTLSRTNSIGSIPLKGRKDLSSPKVLSKQFSFDFSKSREPDKLLFEGQVQKRTKESTSTGMTIDAPVKPIVKSASLKIMNPVSPRAGLVNKAMVHKSFQFKDHDTLADKNKPLKSPRLEGQSCIRPIKEKNKIGRQDGTYPGRSVISMPQMVRARSLKVEQKTTPSDDKVHDRLDPAALSTSKTSNDAKDLRYEEGKVHNTSSFRSSKTIKRPNINAIIAAEGSSNTNIYTNRPKLDIEKGLQKAATKTLNLTGAECTGERTKNSSVSSSEKVTTSCEKELGRLQKAATKTLNLTGTECTGDKTKNSASSLEKVTTSCQKELGIPKGGDASFNDKICAAKKQNDESEGTSKGSRLKDVFRAVIQKNKMNENNRLPEQTDECMMTRNNLTHNVALPSPLNHPKCQKKLISKDDRRQLKMKDPISDSSKTEVEIAMEQANQLVEASCISRLASLDTTDANPNKSTIDEPHSNITRQPVPVQNPVTSSATVPVIPQHEFIWQGAFELFSEGNSPKLFEGIQAHLASSVSPKVIEVVRHIPSQIQLEEVPRANIWPMQFLETGPTEENIALYFFAKDAHSYERSYQMLLDCVLGNDMALRGIINEVELLIFPSNELPDDCQCWNQLLFLWGVFRARPENSSRPRSNLHEELCSSKLSRDLFSSLTCETLIIQKIDSDDNPDNANIRIDEIPESMPIEENPLNTVKLEKAAHVPGVEQLFCEQLPKCLNASSIGLEEYSYQEETKLKEASVKPETVLEEDTAESDHPIRSLKPDSKHSYSCLSATDNKATEVLTTAISWHEKHACSSDDDKKVTKINCHDEGIEVNSHLDQVMARNNSAKVFHLFGEVVEQMQRNDVYCETKPSDTLDLRLMDENHETKPSDTQYLRLIDTDILKGNIQDSFHSLEVEESLSTDSPDLELSLGTRKRLSKEAKPHLFLPVANRNRHVSSGDLAVDEDNITLSLASPGTEVVGSRNSTLKTEQLFPEGSFFKTCRVPFRSFAYT